MSAQQALREYVDTLSDEDAEAIWQWLQRAVEFEPLTDEQRASIERSHQQTLDGKTVPHAEVLRRLHDSGRLRSE
ncbi:MAG: hypothetical protein ACRDHF_04065 [Tepidiformaceae bacterium]